MNSNQPGRVKRIPFPKDLLEEAEAYCREQNIDFSQFVRESAAAALADLKRQKT